MFDCIKPFGWYWDDEIEVTVWLVTWAPSFLNVNGENYALYFAVSLSERLLSTYDLVPGFALDTLFCFDTLSSLSSLELETSSLTKNGFLFCMLTGGLELVVLSDKLIPDFMLVILDGTLINLRRAD